MSGTLLTLGPVIFQDFEIPPTIAFGGSQRLVVRYLATGKRVTDVLGPDDATISFAGILSGPNASSRAHEIDALRSIGQPLVIAWDTYTYSVVIHNFESEFQNAWWIPYKIRCVVLENQNVVAALSSLSSGSDALASLELMYGTVPSALLPIPDVRPGFAEQVANGTGYGPAGITTILQTSIATLSEEQQRREINLSQISPDTTLPTSDFIKAFTHAIGISADLQFLALSRDCVGQAIAYTEYDGRT